ncbi:peptidase domain-containing ABC transporter [Myxococcus sp. Y35]|uniref:peptidase domain-containing ABC transporter n=1 Tax=Pseudomyxococcus flavus TaxID=3115648 RepID=UPI003CF64F29
MSNSLFDRFPALGRIGEHLRRRRVPFIAQLTATDCGAACLAMVLGYWGRRVELDDVHTATGLTLRGVSATALLEAGQRFGLVGRAARVDIDELHLLEPATILHWEFRHFVVFERLTSKGVELVDPGFGRRIVPMEQFRKSFTGVALLFEPSEAFAPGGTVRGPRRYVRLIAERGATLRRVVVMSVLLQLFALALPSLTGAVVDRVVPSGDTTLLGILAAGMGLLVVFQFISSLVRAHLLLHLRTYLDARMTVGFLDHLVRLPFSFLQLRSTGDLMSRLNSNATVRELLTSGALSAVLDGLLVFIYLALLFYGSRPLAFLALGLAALQVLVFLFARKRQRELMSRSLEVTASAQNYEVELFNGMQTLKAMGLEDRAVQHWSNLYVDVLNVSLDRGRLSALTDSLTATLRMASPLATLAVGTWLVLDQQELTLGEMLSINALAGNFLTPISSLVATAFQLQLVGSYLDRVDDILQAKPEQTDDTPRRAHRLQGGIQVEHVSFQYGSRATPVIHDVSVSIQPGQFVAIVGRSGAGKSTMAHLLLGLYLPTQGDILYDGVSLRELDLRDMRRQMGAVLQNPALFHGDIRRNIAYSDPNLPFEQVLDAARRAQIHDEIMAMPMKYETVLSDMGHSLSGGQRQRLALARSLVHSPAILLLDEATNALDTKTERAVQDAIAELRCTRVVIAHRLSTIRDADLILVMDQGRLVEQGRHDELMAQQGHYFELVANHDRHEQQKLAG